MALPDEAMQVDPATGRLRGYDMPRLPPAAAPATPDYSAFSPEQAKAELKRLRADPEYVAKSARNDPGALAQRRALDARAVGLDSTEAQKLLARDPDAVGRANAKEQADAQAAIDARRAESTPKGNGEYIAAMREAPLPVGMEIEPEQLTLLSQVAEAEGFDRRESQQMIVIASIIARDAKSDIPPQVYAQRQQERLRGRLGADYEAKIGTAQQTLNRLASTHPDFVAKIFADEYAPSNAELIGMLIELGERRARTQR
jgi:hypothetical protein